MRDWMTRPMDTILRDETMFCIAHGHIPSPDRIPWGDRRCDAIVVILDPVMLTDALARHVSLRLAAMNNDWVDTVGSRCEELHDLVDSASAEIGRQATVGDGSPMTAWHDELVDPGAMAEFVARGGMGGYDYKLVVIIGSDSQASAFIELMRAACRRPRE